MSKTKLFLWLILLHYFIKVEEEIFSSFNVVPPARWKFLNDIEIHSKTEILSLDELTQSLHDVNSIITLIH